MSWLLCMFLQSLHPEDYVRQQACKQRVLGAGSRRQQGFPKAEKWESKHLIQDGKKMMREGKLTTRAMIRQQSWELVVLFGQKAVTTHMMEIQSKENGHEWSPGNSTFKAAKLQRYPSFKLTLGMLGACFFRFCFFFLILHKLKKTSRSIMLVKWRQGWSSSKDALSPTAHISFMIATDVILIYNEGTYRNLLWCFPYLFQLPTLWAHSITEQGLR